MSGVFGFFKNSINSFVRVSNSEPLPVLLSNAGSLPVVDSTPANAESSIATLVAQTGSSTLVDQSNLDYRGLKVVVDITAISGTGASLTIVLEGKDTLSGKYFIVLSSAALTAIGTTVLTVYPGLAAVASLTANDLLPKTWRIRSVIAGTTPSVTATIGASFHK